MTDSRRWLVSAEQTVTITFEVAADDAGDRDALVAGYLALRRTSDLSAFDDIMDGFFGRAMPSSVRIVKTEPGPWHITSALPAGSDEDARSGTATNTR